MTTEVRADNIMKNNIISLVEYKKENKPKKLKKNGEVKLTHTNKVAGKSSEVYAFKTREDITAMIDVFNYHIQNARSEKLRQVAYRNKLLFLIGINVGIRVSDIRLLKWSFFFRKDRDDYSFKEFYNLQPQKTKRTGKYVKLYFNDAVKFAVLEYIKEYPFEDYDEYIFEGYGGKILTSAQIYKVIKDVAEEACIDYNVGTHSMRKTFGYFAYQNAKDKQDMLNMLQIVFGHSSSAITAKYIGVTDENIRDVFNSVQLGVDFG